MITFIVCLALLIAAYFLYGGLLSRIAKLDKSADVPSKSMYDGVDYMPLPLVLSYLFFAQSNPYQFDLVPI